MLSLTSLFLSVTMHSSLVGLAENFRFVMLLLPLPLTRFVDPISAASLDISSCLDTPVRLTFHLA